MSELCGIERLKNQDVIEYILRRRKAWRLLEEAKFEEELNENTNKEEIKEDKNDAKSVNNNKFCLNYVG